MRRLLVAAAALTMSALAAADPSPSRSEVEARLDALETINVTAHKEARCDTEAADPEVAAILQAAASAEAEPTR